jgi:hypothetical protein
MTIHVSCTKQTTTATEVRYNHPTHGIGARVTPQIDRTAVELRTSSTHLSLGQEKAAFVVSKNNFPSSYVAAVVVVCSKHSPRPSPTGSVLYSSFLVFCSVGI